ncbi:FAD-dependent oxidoreductase [Sinorhizobium terangae]|uniref:FAD-dependent oxidoreductase n=1 Tax=Sinorhizobium terangae TaxID=110322 RepID=A0A6N7LM14_SINTE|nr:FAD-binding oxidoreductase [Sinorhizobium terangae]MQX18911.1 FAD-dependent oxidoreductase [Sinorhizobium terangae]
MTTNPVATRSGERTYDVAIVGGGIMGAATAYYLAKAGVSVGLFEKGRVGGEQSSRNWGAVRQQQRDRAELPMMIESVRLWTGLEEELGTSLDWNHQGHIALVYDEQTGSRYEQWLPVAREFGLDTTMLTSKEVHDLLPHYRDPECTGALFTPSDGCAEPEKVTCAFARAAVLKGAEILELTSVSSIETQNGNACALWTEQGRIRANTILVTSGAWTSRLLKPLGVSHPSLWIRGNVVRTNVLPIELRKLLAWGKTSYRQRSDGRVNIAAASVAFHDLTVPDSFRYGAKFLPVAKDHWGSFRFSIGRHAVRSLMGEFSDFTTHRTLDPRPEWKVLKQAAALFAREYPEAGPITLERAWGGFIDYMPDELPVLGEVPGYAGLFMAAGFSGHGFGLGPVIGRVMADLVRGNPVGHDLTPFSPKRFSKGFRAKEREHA